jgi:hypothetical protein
MVRDWGSGALKEGMTNSLLSQLPMQKEELLGYVGE